MYSGIKKVREMNGQKFIDDFNRTRTFLSLPYCTSYPYELRKREVWESAKGNQIEYDMNYCPYVTTRVCMTIK